jgi:hypothetical protein
LSLFRVRLLCTNPDGTTSPAQSGFLRFVPNDSTSVGDFDFDHVSPIPVSLDLSTVEGDNTFTTLGDTRHIFVSARCRTAARKASIFLSPALRTPRAILPSPPWTAMVW